MKQTVQKNMEYRCTALCIYWFVWAETESSTDKGAISMTEKRGSARGAQPQPQDVDDLIFLGQTGPQVSQR